MYIPQILSGKIVIHAKNQWGQLGVSTCFYTHASEPFAWCNSAPVNLRVSPIRRINIICCKTERNILLRSQDSFDQRRQHIQTIKQHRHESRYTRLLYFRQCRTRQKTGAGQVMRLSVMINALHQIFRQGNIDSYWFG